MPSTKKRINLTIPDDVYARIQQYKAANGILNDASACYQLIIQQLNAADNVALFAKIVRENSLESLMQISSEGFSFLKDKQDQLLPGVSPKKTK